MATAIRGGAAFLAVVGLVFGTLGAGVAWADPLGAKFERHVTMDCGGAPIEAVVNGVGNWPIAHDLNSTRVFIPVQFLGESGVFTDASGVPHPFSNPPGLPKGSADAGGRAIVNCTFSSDTAFPDGSSVVATGSLRGFFSS
jgi:hypothetical protein